MITHLLDEWGDMDATFTPVTMRCGEVTLIDPDGVTYPMMDFVPAPDANCLVDCAQCLVFMASEHRREAREASHV